MKSYIRIVRLLASDFIRFSSRNNLSPETEVLKQFYDWATGHDMFNRPYMFQGFGFNNPAMNSGSLRGYDVLFMVPEGFDPGENMKSEHFEGGLYAVSRVKGVESIAIVVKSIVEWLVDQDEYESAYPKDYDYYNRPSLELENYVNPPGQGMDDIVFDYYYPIKLKQGK